MTERRARRTTAGQRLTLLTGEDLDNDEAFWGHDTWQEDNESFHTSDEEGSAAVDQFDSDFDATESEGEDEVAEAQAAERVIEAEEKDRKRKKSNYVDTATTNAKKSRKLTGIAAKRTKRVVGDGHNAGIVLNVPVPGATANGTATGGPGETVHIPRIVVPGPSKKRKPSPTKPPPMAATRQRRQAKEASGYSSKSRSVKVTNTASSKHPPSSLRTQSNVQTQQQRKQQQQQKQFTQEQLLMEAVADTEPSNQRWLLGRQRRLAASEAAVAAAPTASATMISVQWTSRRGALNTVTFGDMDKIPSIFTASPNGGSHTSNAPAVCAVTGAPARYKDPVTGIPYASTEAFRTLRERHRKECAVKEEAARKRAAAKAAKQAESSAKEAAVVATGNEETETTTSAKPKPKRKAPPRTQSAATAGSVADSTTASKPTKKTGGKATVPKKPGRKRKAAPTATASSTTSAATATSEPNRKLIASTQNDATTTNVTSQISTTSETSNLHNPTQPLAPSTVASTATTAQPLPNNTNTTTPAQTHSNSTTTTPTAGVCPPSPSCSHKTTPDPSTPLSPGRRSGRKRKPSAKILESAELGSTVIGQSPIPPPPASTD